MNVLHSSSGATLRKQAPAPAHKIATAAFASFSPLHCWLAAAGARARAHQAWRTMGGSCCSFWKHSTMTAIQDVLPVPLRACATCSGSGRQVAGGRGHATSEVI